MKSDLLCKENREGLGRGKQDGKLLRGCLSSQPQNDERKKKEPKEKKWRREKF
jgi:hypothetical protein